MKLSIVSSLYNSPETIALFLSKCSMVAKDFAGTDFEIVLVEDGCPEGSAAVAEKAGANIPQLRVVRLSRNFGQHRALMEGFRQTTGELVFVLDSDLEENPEWLCVFHRVMLERSCDVVYGFQGKSRRGFIDRVQGLVGYGLIRALTNLSFQPNSVTARLMTRSYVDALCLHTENKIWLGGLFEITGFRQQPFEVTKRKSSRSNYTFWSRLFQLGVAILSFSERLLVITGALGLAGAGVAVGAAGFFVYQWLAGGVIDGWTSTITSIWILGGLALFSISVLIQYVSVIFIEVKNRPNVIVRGDRS